MSVHVELKPYRQTWLSPEVLHSSPKAELFTYPDGEQWVQLEHPRGGGSLGCIKNRTGLVAKSVVRIGDKWMWEFDQEPPTKPPKKETPAQINVKLYDALEQMCAEFRAVDLPYGSKAYDNANSLLNKYRGKL